MDSTARGGVAVAIAMLVAACPRAEPLVEPDVDVSSKPRISDADLTPTDQALPDSEPTVVLELGTPVTLTSGQQVLLRELSLRKIEIDPDDIELRTDGAEIEALLDFNGTQVTLARSSTGYEADATRWANDHRVTLMEVEPTGQGVGVRIERVGTRALGAPLPVRLELHQEVEMPDGSYVRLLGHSRESTTPGDSPLLVELMFWVWGGDFSRQQVRLDGNGSQWSFRSLKFTLRGYEFERWMDIEVQRVALEPVKAR